VKKILTLTLLLCLATGAFAQNSFEGEIIYKVSVKSNTRTVTEQEVTHMIGTEQHFYVKRGNSKTTNNGAFSSWQSYSSKDKRNYYQPKGIDTIFWLAAINKDTVKRIELRKNDTTILGYKCDKLTFFLNNATEVFYFSKQLAIDPEFSMADRSGIWYIYLTKAGSWPLKQIHYGKLYNTTTTAIKVERKKVSDDIFKLPPRLPVVKGRF